MKKQFKLALAVVMILGSVKAMAMSDAEIDAMNTEGKIEAAMADRCLECDGSMDIMEGKIEASAIMNMHIMVEDAQKQVKKIQSMGDMVGQSMEDSHGLIKFMGQQEMFADMALQEMKRIEKTVDNLSGDAIFTAHTRMSKLASDIRELNESTQMTVDKVMFGRK